MPYLIKTCMGENTLKIATDCGLGGRVDQQIARAQAARSTRRRGNREQEVVELNSKCLCGMKERKRKKLEVNV